MGNVKKGAAEERHYLYVTMHRSNLPRAKGRWLARTDVYRALQFNPDYQDATDLDAELKKLEY